MKILLTKGHKTIYSKFVWAFISQLLITNSNTEQKLTEYVLFCFSDIITRFFCMSSLIQKTKCRHTLQNNKLRTYD